MASQETRKAGFGKSLKERNHVALKQMWIRLIFGLSAKWLLELFENDSDRNSIDIVELGLVQTRWLRPLTDSTDFLRGDWL